MLISCGLEYFLSLFTGQFKSARSFYWMTRHYNSIGIRMTWSFFESGHGKGEHDGAGKRMGLMKNLPNLVKFALYLIYLVFLGACVKSALQ